MTDDDFLAWLQGHADWYEWQSTKWNWTLSGCRFASLAATIVTITAAAAMPPDVISGWGRWLIVAAGSFTAASSEILNQLKVRDMEELREDGNIQMHALCIFAKQRLSEANGDQQKRTALMDEVREKVQALEHAQHRGHVELDKKKPNAEA